MSERSDHDLLCDIRQAVARIGTYTAGLSYEDFAGDTKTQDAVVRNIEIIGEATKGLSPALRDRHAQIPWRGMAGARDRLIHHYFGVNLDIVWDIVTVELPVLQSQLDAISGPGSV